MGGSVGSGGAVNLESVGSIAKFVGQMKECFRVITAL